MNAAQTIIDQDNAMLEKYIQALDDAQAALEEARDNWNNANNAAYGADGQKTAETAGQLDQAIANYRQAAGELARWISSAHRSGYRLHRD